MRATLTAEKDERIGWVLVATSENGKTTFPTESRLYLSPSDVYFAITIMYEHKCWDLQLDKNGDYSILV